MSLPRSHTPTTGEHMSTEQPVSGFSAAESDELGTDGLETDDLEMLAISDTPGAAESSPARIISGSSSKLPVPVEVSHIVSGRPSQPTVRQRATAPPHDPRTGLRPLLAKPYYTSISSNPRTRHYTKQFRHPHTCDSLDCAMVKAVATTEVLENILTFLPTSEVLQLQLVSKRWNSVIKESPRLRLHLFVEPQWRIPAPEFQLLPLFIQGYALEIKRGDPVHLGQWVEIRMDLAAAKRIRRTRNRPSSQNKVALLLRPSSRYPFTLPRYSDLLITQPPLKGMQVFLVDEDDTTHEATSDQPPSSTVPTAHSKFSCDAGITLGFVADVAENMFRKRRTSDQVEYHEDKVAVFKAIVSFCVQSDSAPRMRSTTRTVTKIE